MMQEREKPAFDQNRVPLVAEQVGVGSSPDEYDDTAFAGGIVRFVDEQEVSADMTFTVGGPFAF